MNKIDQLYPDIKSSEEIRSFIWSTIEDRLGLQEHDLVYIESTSGNHASPLKPPPLRTPFLSIGGLAGFPFQGMSGLSIDPQSISENGGVLIFYTCDIDLETDDKTAIQSSRSSVSGRGSAVNSALKKLLNGQILLEHISELDYQMNFIEQLLFREQRKVKTADFPLLEAAEVVYEALDRRIQLLFAKTNYRCRYVILAGAIRFQDEGTGESCFVLKRFVCLDPVTKKKIDWKRVKENS